MTTHHIIHTSMFMNDGMVHIYTVATPFYSSLRLIRCAR